MSEGFITRVSTPNDVAAEALRGLSARRKTEPRRVCRMLKILR